MIENIINFIKNYLIFYYIYQINNLIKYFNKSIILLEGKKKKSLNQLLVIIIINNDLI